MTAESESSSSSDAWDSSFESTVRSFLPLLGASDRLPPNTSLSELGLDSLSTVGLLVELEQLMGVEIEDEQLTPEMFGTALTLWKAMCRMKAEDDH